jgi:hypothetical protein
MECQLYIDNDPFQFTVEGNFFWGEGGALFEAENNIISKTNWKNEGYSVVNAFEGNEFERFNRSVRDNIVAAMLNSDIAFDPDSFQLKDYHKVVTNNEDHLKVINITRNLTNADFDFDIDKLADRFGKELGYELTSWIEALQKSHIQIRISRPSTLDINPPHRDGYLDYWKDIINVWVPVEGCNEQTSLPVVPGSHLIAEEEILRTESKGAKINGNTYFVPCILKTRKGNLKMVRPNPKEGEALIFTPFLIHGAAVNRSEVTRVSIELRFPKVSG